MLIVCRSLLRQRLRSDIMGDFMALGSANCVRLLLATSVLGTAGIAQAQTSPGLPSREEIAPNRETSTPPQQSVRIDSNRAVEAGNCPLSESDVRTTIATVEFTGPGGAPLPAVIAPLLQSIKGMDGEQPIKVVCDIRDRANAILRKARYVASVQIPAQRIDNGVLKLEVVTAKIVEMRVRGDAGPYERVLEGRIAALKSLDPLNEADAEEMLLLAGDVPGLDVQLSLRPRGTVPGEVIGDLTVSYRRVAVLVNAQNYNSKQLGRESGYIRAEIYGLTGLSDLTYVGLSSTKDFKEQRIAQLGHIMGIGHGNMTIGARVTGAWSRPSLDTIDLRTKSLIAGFDIVKPIIRSVTKNVTLTGGFEYISQSTRIFNNVGSAPLNRDRLSTVFLRATGDLRKLRFDGLERFRIGVSLELRQGLGLFGATKPGVASNGYLPSRFEGDAKATVARLQLDAKIGLGPIFSLAGTTRGQWANKPLLNFDEFAVGNLTIGRGYDPGANSADRAVGGSIEARARLVNRPNFVAEPFAFYDIVRLYNLDSNSTEDRRTLRSYGAGVRVTLPGRLLFEVTYARPQDKALSFDKQRPPSRVLMSLTMQVLPWGARR
jgi:hemolysin activation/secretion protein